MLIIRKVNFPKVCLAHLVRYLIGINVNPSYVFSDVVMDITFNDDRFQCAASARPAYRAF